MAIESKQIKSVVYEVPTDTDVGAGAPSTLTGFAAQTVGFSGATDGYQQYPVGTFLLARNPAGSGARLYLIQLDSLSAKVAVLLTTGSATPATGGIPGSTILFLVAPAALGLPNSFATVAAVLADAGYLAATDAAIVILPGSYTETAALPLKGGTAIYALSGPKLSPIASPVKIILNTSGFTWSATPGTVSFSNIQFELGTGVGLINMSVVTSVLTFTGCTFDPTDTNLITVTSVAEVQMTECSTSNTTILGINAPLSRCVLKRSSILIPVTCDEIDVDDCKTERLTVNSGSIVRSEIDSASLGTSAIQWASNSNTLIVRDCFVSVEATATTVIQTTTGSPGTLRTGGLSRKSTCPTNIPWFVGAPGIFQISDGVMAAGLAVAVTPDPVANFSFSPGGDELTANPTTGGLQGTLPPASSDITGRRIVIRNQSNANYFELVSPPGETIDAQSSNVFLAPQEPLEVTVDRFNGKLRRVTPRGNTYLVAKPWSFIPGSFPTIAAALQQITIDKSVNPDLSLQGTPVIMIYPGTYIENLVAFYAVEVVGVGGSFGSVVINGTVSLTAGIANRHFAMRNIRVNGVTTFSDGGFASDVVFDSCWFDSTAGGTALSLGGFDATTTQYVINCLISHGSTGISVNCAGAAVLRGCKTFTANQLDLLIVAAGVGSSCMDCDFAGGVALRGNLLFANNRYGSNAGTGATLEFPAVMDNNIFYPNAIGDYSVSTSAMPPGTLGRIAYASNCSAINPTNFTNAVNNFESRTSASIVALPAFLDANLGYTVITDPVAGIATLPPAAAYPQGATIYVINNTAVAHTLAANPGESFGPIAGAPATIPLAAYSFTILVMDAQISKIWVK